MLQPVWKGCLLLSLVWLLSSCSAVDVIKTAAGLGGGGGPSLDVEVTAGDKNQAVNTNIGDTVAAEAVTIVNELDYGLMFIALLGWVLPTPTRMMSGTSGFILKLFGRKS